MARERKLKHPVLSPSFFRMPGFVVITIIAHLQMLTMAAVLALAPLYLSACGEECNWQPWGGALLHTLPTGEPAFEHVCQSGRFAYIAAHPDVAAKFDPAMSSLTNQDSRAVVEACDFSTSACVVDVGGGKGIILRAFLEACPTVRGVLFDLPSVVARAQSA